MVYDWVHTYLRRFIIAGPWPKKSWSIGWCLDSLQRCRGQLRQDPGVAVGKEHREEEPSVTAFQRLSHGQSWRFGEWLVNDLWLVKKYVYINLNDLNGDLIGTSDSEDVWDSVVMRVFGQKRNSLGLKVAWNGGSGKQAGLSPYCGEAGVGWTPNWGHQVTTPKRPLVI